MRSDWDKSPNEIKAESFFSEPDKLKGKKKNIEKPFIAQQRFIEVPHSVFNSLRKWIGRRFATLQLAQDYIKKCKREAWADRKEFRIIDDEGKEYVD